MDPRAALADKGTVPAGLMRQMPEPAIPHHVFKRPEAFLAVIGRVPSAAKTDDKAARREKPRMNR